MAMQQTGSDLNKRETGALIGSDKVEGTDVYNSNGDRVGTIERVMIDKIGGKVAYAVMSFGGFLGLGSDYYPLPWSLLKYNELLGGPADDLAEDHPGVAARSHQRGAGDRAHDLVAADRVHGLPVEAAQTAPRPQPGAGPLTREVSQTGTLQPIPARYPARLPPATGAVRKALPRPGLDRAQLTVQRAG